MNKQRNRIAHTPNESQNQVIPPAGQDAGVGSGDRGEPGERRMNQTRRRTAWLMANTQTENRLKTIAGRCSYEN